MPSYNRKEFKESNVNYLNKDFGNLKNSLMDYAKAYFPNTYKDFNETSPGMMLIEMSAYVGDVLSFYIDQQYREMMLPLSEERRNVVNIGRMLGYKVKPTSAAFVDLTFSQDVAIIPNVSNKVDYSKAGQFNKGLKVTSTTNSDIVFETLDIIDFSISGSGDLSIPTIDSSTGLASAYELTRTVRAISGETKTTSFDTAAPTKFLKLTLSDTNVIDIISVKDTNGNTWYEVDYLAQDRVPIETHYTSDEDRATAYQSVTSPNVTQEVVPVPYSLQYIQTGKRFVTEVNDDNTTSLVFGNGILRNGTTIDEGFLDLEQAGVVIPGQTYDLQDAINPLLGDVYSTLGETPIQTTLTVTYRVGGGITSNAVRGDLIQVDSTTEVDLSGNGSSIKSVINDRPAVGGKGEDSINEIREKTKAFFTTQNRCVTKEDYEARVMNMPSKFGNIAKVYVVRRDVGETAGLISADVSANFAVFQSIADELDAGIGDDYDSFKEIMKTFGDDDVWDGDDTKFWRNDYQTKIDNLHTVIATAENTFSYEVSQQLGNINVYVLSYDDEKNLIGNPHSTTLLTNDNVPKTLKDNIKNYLNEFRILTDEVIIQDGYIINFGVFFDVVAQKFANKQEVKLKCINIIKDYFHIDKMQFSQPIFVSQLEYELMSVDGVRAVNYVSITQGQDYETTGGESFSPNLYSYSFLGGGTVQNDISNTQLGYNWKYDFSPVVGANQAGVILPANPSNPAVFELKNPNENIKGVVR